MLLMRFSSILLHPFKDINYNRHIRRQYLKINTVSHTTSHTVYTQVTLIQQKKTLHDMHTVIRSKLISVPLFPGSLSVFMSGYQYICAYYEVNCKLISFYHIRSIINTVNDVQSETISTYSGFQLKRECRSSEGTASVQKISMRGLRKFMRSEVMCHHANQHNLWPFLLNSDNKRIGRQQNKRK